MKRPRLNPTDDSGDLDVRQLRTTLAPLLYISIAIFVLVPIASGYRRTRVAEAASE